jgi:hypothetical protein
MLRAILLLTGEINQGPVTPLTWLHFAVSPTAVAQPKAQPKYAERGGQSDGFKQKRICVRNRHRQSPCCNRHADERLTRE